MIYIEIYIFFFYEHYFAFNSFSFHQGFQTDVGNLLNVEAAVEAADLTKTKTTATTPPAHPMTPKATPAASPDVTYGTHWVDALEAS